MTLDTPSTTAFLQLDPHRFALADGPLVPLESAPPGTPAFVAPCFSLEQRCACWFAPEGGKVRTLAPSEWRTRFAGAAAPGSCLAWHGPDETRFRAAYESLARLLAAGRLRKGVPITVMRAPLAPDLAAPLFRRLLARVPDLPPGVNAYGLFLPATASRGPEFIIGATPELLFEIEEDGCLRTMAVAGTRKAEEGEGTELLSSGKDRAEHEAVVEDLLEQARRWGKARALPVEVRRFGGLFHLVREIEVLPEGRPGFEEAIAALHPTPALGVSPRSGEGSAWLRAIDPCGERGRFGAPFGLRWPSGAGRAAVAIRSLQYQAGHVEIWAGCGVVAASDYDAEWQEALDKMQAVRTLWGV